MGWREETDVEAEDAKAERDKRIIGWNGRLGRKKRSKSNRVNDESSKSNPVNDDNENNVITWKKTITKIIQVAVEHYKEHKGIDLEIVEIVDKKGSMDAVFGYEDEGLKSGFWYHVNFKARPKTAHCSNGTDVSPQLFFAEVIKGGRRDTYYHVETCSVVEPDDPGTTTECGICPPLTDTYHPAKGFSAGHWPYPESYMAFSDI